LNAPTNLALQRIRATTAALSWIDASTNETSFQVQVSADNGASWANVGGAVIRDMTQSTATGTTLSTVVAVSNATNALYRVNAINASDLATSASVRLNNTAAPVAPSGLTGTKAPINIPLIGRIGTTVTLSWTDLPNNNASFILQRSVDNGVSWANVGRNLAGNLTTTTVRFTNLTPVTNQYRIRAVNSVGASVWSNVFTIKTP